MMRRPLLIALIFLLLILLFAAVWYVFSNNNKDKDVLILYGNVDVRQVDMGFRVAGVVETLNFEEGDYVKKGSLVATLNKTPFDMQHRQAQANRESAKINLINTEKLLKRRQELIDIGGVSQEDLDNAQATHDEQQAVLHANDASVAVAFDNLSYTEIYAPTDGIILTRIREPGTVVNPSDPVYTLSVTSPVWIRAFVDEPHLSQIYYGMEAEIITDPEGGPTYSGKIGFISPVSEFTPKTVETTSLRTDLVYRLRIYVDNPDCYLKQGMPVTVRLKLDPQRVQNNP